MMGTNKSQSPMLHTRISRQQQREIEALVESSGKQKSEIFREALQKLTNDKKTEEELLMINIKLEKIEANLEALCDLLQGGSE